MYVLLHNNNVWGFFSYWEWDIKTLELLGQKTHRMIWFRESFLLFIFHFLMEFLWKLFFILKKQFVKFIYVFDFTYLFWPAHCDFDCLFWKLMITSHIRSEFLKDICTYIWLPWLLVLLQIYDEIKNFVQFG